MIKEEKFQPVCEMQTGIYLVLSVSVFCSDSMSATSKIESSKSKVSIETISLTNSREWQVTPPLNEVHFIEKRINSDRSFITIRN